ncbi:borealin-2 [Brachionichthys hirsutus]|uniref:borealin-2 n=1 Tax=Brachionichthys hirsutus TaxID=412623 RepID=UPI0036045714
MSVRRKRNAGTTPGDEQLGRRKLRTGLFMQEVEKEAQARMNELEAKIENQRAIIDKAFKVEVMKMPLSLQDALLADLIRDEEGESESASEVSIAMKKESLQVDPPLRRLPSKRREAAGEETKRPRTLVGSSSTGSLRGSTPAKRAQNYLKTVEQSVPRKRPLRSVVSAGNLHCSMVASAAHITVTTGRGQAVSFSEETRDEINLDVLDDVAWSQIQRLKNLMDYLSRQGRRQK